MDRVCAVLRYAVGALMAALVAVVAIAVIFRYFLNSSLYWATEVPNFLLVWIVFLGAVVAFHEKKHIAFDLVAKSAPPPVRRRLGALSTGLVLAFVGIVTFHGVGLVAQTIDSPSEALKVPQAWLYLCLPVSTALMGVSALQDLVRLLARAEA